MYKEVIRKRLERKRTQLKELETSGAVTPEDKRKYVEIKAVIMELENVIDIAETMFAEASKSDKKE